MYSIFLSFNLTELLALFDCRNGAIHYYTCIYILHGTPYAKGGGGGVTLDLSIIFLYGYKGHLYKGQLFIRDRLAEAESFSFIVT